MSPGEPLILWTIRLAVALYGLSAGLQLAARGREGWRRLARSVWTAGCVIYVVHVLAAFHFYHHWSHAALLEHTARRTEAVVGVRVGDGVYASYLFTILWILDSVAWWIIGTARYAARPPWFAASLHAFFAFIMFNGTVIFASGAIRSFGLAMFACLTALFAGVLGRMRHAEC